MTPAAAVLIAAGLLALANNTPPSINGASKTLKRTRFFKPYKKTPSGTIRPTLPNKYYRRAGVYVIRNRNTRKIIYVGHSKNNVKRTLYRHFQSWNDRKQHRYVYDPRFYEVTVYKVSETTAPKLEKALIKKYNPPDNKQKYPSLFDNLPDFDTQFFANHITKETPF